MYTNKELNDLTKKQLIDLIEAYDNYIIDFCSSNAGYKIEDDVVPACLMEFLDNEYQDLLDSRFN